MSTVDIETGPCPDKYLVKRCRGFCSEVIDGGQGLLENGLTRILARGRGYLSKSSKLVNRFNQGIQTVVKLGLMRQYSDYYLGTVRHRGDLHIHKSLATILPIGTYLMKQRVFSHFALALV